MTNKLTSQKQRSAQSRIRLKGNDWLIIPLGIVVIICVTLFVPNIATFNTIFTLHALVIVLTAIFSVLYIYRVITQKNIRPLAKIIAYIISIIFLGVLILSVGQSCVGFFGAQRTCNDAVRFLFWLILLNPFSLPILLFLSAGGLATLLASKAKR
jgi:flagellar biosynthesis protein FlhB